MADTQSIYNRLHAGSSYRPLSAETFGDWSIEAGDVVAAVKNGATHRTPVMNNRFKWNGASMVTIESEGKKQRDPVSVASKKAYRGRSGGGGYYNEEKLYQFEVNQNHLWYDVYNENGTMHTSFEATAEQIQGIVENVNAQGTEFNSRITQLANSIETEVRERKQDGTELRSRITQTADKLALVVDDGGIKAASIVAQINKTGSSVKISADHVDIDGILTADRIESAVAKIDAVKVKGLTTTGSVSLGGTTHVTGPINVSGTLNATGNFWFGSKQVTWKDMTVVKSINLATNTRQRYAIADSNLNVTDRQLGYLIDTVDKGTIYYLGRS